MSGPVQDDCTVGRLNLCASVALRFKAAGQSRRNEATFLQKARPLVRGRDMGAVADRPDFGSHPPLRSFAEAHKHILSGA